MFNFSLNIVIGFQRYTRRIIKMWNMKTTLKQYLSVSNEVTSTSTIDLL